MRQERLRLVRNQGIRGGEAAVVINNYTVHVKFCLGGHILLVAWQTVAGHVRARTPPRRRALQAQGREQSDETRQGGGDGNGRDDGKGVDELLIGEDAEQGAGTTHKQTHTGSHTGRLWNPLLQKHDGHDVSGAGARASQGGDGVKKGAKLVYECVSEKNLGCNARGAEDGDEARGTRIKSGVRGIVQDDAKDCETETGDASEETDGLGEGGVVDGGDEDAVREEQAADDEEDEISWDGYEPAPDRQAHILVGWGR